MRFLFVLLLILGTTMAMALADAYKALEGLGFQEDEIKLIVVGGLLGFAAGMLQVATVL